MEQVVAPPPPTEPELDDPTTFDPKVMGVWDYLLAQMTDEQKQSVREQATGRSSPSYRHTTPVPPSSEQVMITSDVGPMWSMSSSSVTTHESRNVSCLVAQRRQLQFLQFLSGSPDCPFVGHMNRSWLCLTSSMIFGQKERKYPQIR